MARLPREMLRVDQIKKYGGCVVKGMNGKPLLTTEVLIGVVPIVQGENN